MSEFRWNGEIIKTAKLTAELIKEADAVIITTAHKHKVDYKLVVDNAKLIFDTKNILKTLGISGENVEVL